MRRAGVTQGALAVMVAFLLLLMVGLAAAALSPRFRHQLGVSVERRPADVTELYFDPATPLPRMLLVNQPVTLTYVIVNRTGGFQSYSASIRTGDGQGPDRSDTAGFFLYDGQSARGQVVLTPTRHAARYTVTVALSETQLLRFSAQTAP